MLWPALVDVDGIWVTEAPPGGLGQGGEPTSAFVEPLAGRRSYGTWLVSTGAGGAPVASSTRAAPTASPCAPRRYYLPYPVTLRKFSHDVYPGTQIPKNFSSLVHLSNPARGEERDVLIYMNQPLRYDGQGLLPGQLRQGRHPLHPPGGGQPRLAAALHLLRADHPGPAVRTSASPCSTPSSAARLAGEAA